MVSSEGSSSLVSVGSWRIRLIFRHTHMEVFCPWRIGQLRMLQNGWKDEPMADFFFGISSSSMGTPQGTEKVVKWREWNMILGSSNQLNGQSILQPHVAMVNVVIYAAEEWSYEFLEETKINPFPRSRIPPRTSLSDTCPIHSGPGPGVCWILGHLGSLPSWVCCLYKASVDNPRKSWPQPL